MEKVGNVSLDYTFYSGTDTYSDGTIEEDMLEYAKSGMSDNDILNADDRWPILYHFSPVRKNILEWYEFDKEASVLEVGAGCGAITGVLCDKVKKVTCVDLSKQRSLINANRNKSYSNLNIVVGNFNDIVFNEKFDYITLIGVLEYANYYTDAPCPFVKFLENLKSYLKDGGKLLIAIENKFGIKYWAGAPEDHTGRFFDSISNYDREEEKVRTFSKSELEDIIVEAGYKSCNFYYPFPDYKFPTQIFSDEYLPDEGELVCSSDSYDADRILMFDQNAALRNVIRSGKFDFFSNSFFVEVEL